MIRLKVERVAFSFSMAPWVKLRTHPALQADVERRARNIADACGEGYVMAASPPRRRARAAVVALPGRGANDNAKHNTLIRNLGIGAR